MNKCLSLLALALVACGQGRVALDSETEISSAFTPEQTESVLAAVDAWKTATSGKVRLRLHVGVDCSSCQLRIAPGRLAWEYGDTDSDGDRATITLNARALDKAEPANPGAFQYAAMHELGHAFGLDHEPGGLMNADGLGCPYVDRRTLERFEQNY